MSSAPEAAGADEPERTADGRHLIIGGRKWRASDPSIPEALRAELVAELMAARRSVGAGRRAGDDAAVAEARRRVHDAKVALGERGRAWWEPATPEAVAERVASSIRTLLAHRGPTKSICPSDVARVVGGEQWRSRMDEARAVARHLARDGVVRLTAGETELNPDEPVRGPIRIRLPPAQGDS